MKNIRSLPKVKEFPDVFSEKIPVYFRVDLLRIIALNFLLKANVFEYAVYLDLDIPIVSLEQLFDKRTLSTLRDHKLVMANMTNGNFENGLLIQQKSFEMSQAVDLVLIKANLMRAIDYLNHYAPIVDKDKNASKLYEVLKGVVYVSYPAVFKFYWYLKGWGKIWGKDHFDIEKDATKFNFKITLDYAPDPPFEHFSKTPVEVFYNPKGYYLYPSKILDIPNPSHDY